jgi:hypothetical protein
MARMAAQHPGSLWTLKQACFDAVQRLCRTAPGAPPELFFVSFMWSVTRYSARSGADEGALIFLDATTRRAWALDPGCEFGKHVCRPSQAWAHRRADELFCLLTSIGFAPVFVRFFVYNDKAELPADLLEPDVAEPRPDRVDCGDARYGEVSTAQYRPALRREVLHTVDATAASDILEPHSIQKRRAEVFGGAEGEGAAGGGSGSGSSSGSVDLQDRLLELTCCDHRPGAGTRVGPLSADDTQLERMDARSRIDASYRTPARCSSRASTAAPSRMTKGAWRRRALRPAPRSRVAAAAASSCTAAATASARTGSATSSCATPLRRWVTRSASARDGGL